MTPHRHDASGFSLIETLIAMTVMLVVLAGATQIMTSAVESENAATQVLDMNGHLRAAMDLVQRDLLQAGQGLPVGRRVGVPSGSALQRINRPGPPADGACAGVDDFPDIDSLPAVNVGPDLGPAINGQCTDVITILAADNLFSLVPVAAIAADGSTLTIHDSVNISDAPDALSDNLRPGDLLMLTKGDGSVLVQVTGVAGQVLSLGTGSTADPLRLNQRNTNLTAADTAGTINLFKASAPADPNAPVVVGGVQQQGPSLATRVRMITYFVDTAPAIPRLVRQVGGAQPNAVAIGVEAFRVTFDLADQNANPTNVRMDASDLAGTGACPDDGGTPELEACSENQIRKVNIVLSMRAQAPEESRLLAHGNQSRSTLYSQVSLRSLAFVDRYQ
jgi:prepilin-type N-terminal cleavage/methylation domain-containing protein